MMNLRRNFLLSLAAALTIGGSSLAASSDEVTQGPETTIEIFVALDGWGGVLMLESDGDVELAGGQQLGEWRAIQDMESSGGSFEVTLDGGATLDLSFLDTPQAGDSGLASLDLGGSLLNGNFEIMTMPVEICVQERKETCYCIDVGTEQHSQNGNRHIKKVWYVVKCGVGWYEVELVDGSRHQLHIIVTGNAGQSGKGTTSFDNKVSFVSFKPCP